jgi:hypothetical protein
MLAFCSVSGTPVAHYQFMQIRQRIARGGFTDGRASIAPMQTNLAAKKARRFMAMISRNQRNSTWLDEPRNLYGSLEEPNRAKTRIGICGEGFSRGATPKMSRYMSQKVARTIWRAKTRTPGDANSIASAKSDCGLPSSLFVFFVDRCSRPCHRMSRRNYLFGTFRDIFLRWDMAGGGK